MKKVMPVLFICLGIFLLIAAYIFGQQAGEHWAINRLVSMATMVAGSISMVLGVVTYILVREEDNDVW